VGRYARKQAREVLYLVLMLLALIAFFGVIFAAQVYLCKKKFPEYTALQCVRPVVKKAKEVRPLPR
jgi:hypothetical protein